VGTSDRFETSFTDDYEENEVAKADVRRGELENMFFRLNRVSSVLLFTLSRGRSDRQLEVLVLSRISQQQGVIVLD
jgi:hypothetical protein